MLVLFIGLLIVYALSHYWITINKRDFFSTVLVIVLPFVGVIYFGTHGGWQNGLLVLLGCVAAAYIGTKAGLKRIQRKTKVIRTSFYEDGNETPK